jgi:preprotein translocase subunit SecA
MIGALVRKIVGTKNERELRRLAPLVDRINQLEPATRKLSDAGLKEKTSEFKCESFAVVREAGRRVLDMRHFDVQLMGGIVLHRGKIAEMKTGEGKTLVATLAVYLNALAGGGVHVVTVNDYLARRDTEWMGGIYRSLGLSVGTVQHEMGDRERRQAYAADVTYGTNNEFGFDYLRDNMKFSLEDYVQRELHYAIVDEVDSILIDEARTPLIISGPAEESTELYYQIDRVVPRLRRAKDDGDGDYQVDEKTRAVVLTEQGEEKAEKLLNVENLSDPANIEIRHHLYQALRAHMLYKRDVDYVVKSGEVIIVDEFTGRLMHGRRYSEGLHQALEAKEHLKVANENQTLASITFQNYFRMYEKLAGMTGTADTEAAEFQEIYGLDVVIIPTNCPLIRYVYPDVVYRTEAEKFRAVVREIEELHEVGRPVLVGTISIEKSERLSGMLRRRGIAHHVLNAKHDEREAEIVAEAGQGKSVTIATNMAGRGTDIILGEGVPKLGGLHIVGTERHEARRIDNQLRGRAGRQGDPGSSRFYLSLEDDLLRLFGSDRISGIMQKLGMEEDQPIEHGLITKAIENAQGKVEGHNFDIRKQLLEYDDVMSKQRQVIYEFRRRVVEGVGLKEDVHEMMGELVEDLVAARCGDDRHLDEWDYDGLRDGLRRHFSLDAPMARLKEASNAEELQGFLSEKVKAIYDYKEKEYGPERVSELVRFVMLHVLDKLWKDHLLNMDHLKEGIGLRGYAQVNPLNAYKKEGFEMFMQMEQAVKEEIVSILCRVQMVDEDKVRRPGREQAMYEHRGGLVSVGAPASAAQEEGGNGRRSTTPYRRDGRKIGRNEPCPCGSGLKYKRCCGR